MNTIIQLHANLPDEPGLKALALLQSQKPAGISRSGIPCKNDPQPVPDGLRSREVCPHRTRCRKWQFFAVSIFGTVADSIAYPRNAEKHPGCGRGTSRSPSSSCPQGGSRSTERGSRAAVTFLRLRPRHRRKHPACLWFSWP